MNVTDEQVALLARFVKKIMADFPDFDALDLCDLQDIAEEHKILERHIVYSPCGENCNCAQFYSTEEMQAGVPCYRLAEWLDRAAELPLEPSAQHSEAGDAPTLSGLYNCQLCGMEKCSQPGICKDCLSEPSKAEVDQWSAANPASS